MWFCQSFRDERLQGRTVSFVSFHATWWRKCKEKPSQLQRTGYIHTYFIEAQWMALSRNSRDPQLSCIQLFFPNINYWLRKPPENKVCANHDMLPRKNEMCILKSSILSSFLFPQQGCSICCPSAPCTCWSRCAGILKFATKVVANSTSTWKMRTKGEID